MKRFNILSILILLTILIFAPRVFSHGSGGEFVQEKDGFKIDVGYDPKDIYANEPSNFDFRLLKDDQNVEYSDIWVRITQENKTILATGVHNQNFGGTTLLYEFPKGGIYTIHFRYQNDGESIVESEFPVTVLDSSDESQNSNKPLLFLVVGLIAFALGIALGVIIGRTTKILR